jgi:hypothetical protein
MLSLYYITSQKGPNNHQENQKAAIGYKRQTSNKLELAASDYIKAT